MSITLERINEIVAAAGKFPYWGNYRKFMTPDEIDAVNAEWAENPNGASSFASTLQAMRRRLSGLPQSSSSNGPEPHTVTLERLSVMADQVASVREARAALQGLLDQVEQMRGMFNDDDGTIADAIGDAETALDGLGDLLKAVDLPAAPDTLTAALTTCDIADRYLDDWAEDINGGGDQADWPAYFAKRCAVNLLRQAAETAAPAVTLDRQETATVLAALRTYQQAGYDNPKHRPWDIHEIATACDECISLDGDAIDRLCERINCGTVETNGTTQAKAYLAEARAAMIDAVRLFDDLYLDGGEGAGQQEIAAFDRLRAFIENPDVAKAVL